MARPQQLQPGSINPAAKPVNVVLQTAAPQIARPGQPQAFPQPSLIATQGTGGTTFVQGENKFKDLAQSLGNFNQALSRTGPQVVTALANYAIDQGEAEAIELAQRAMAKVDESTEVAEIERARANRQLAREDRPAGILMDFLNPYRQIGHQRGRAKLAAMEIQARMPGYVAQRAGEIDYTTADQGFTALEKIRADLNAEVTQKYGISPGSPGFTKFYLPALAQAGEKAGTQIAEDRVKFFDQQIPSQLATEIRATVLNALNAGYVTTGVGDEAVVIPMMVQERGQVVPNPQFHEAVQAKLNQIAQSYAARAGLPGQAQERFKDAFQILSAEADYGDNAAFKNFIDNVVPGENQAPWGLTYAQERIDSVIKYGQAGFARNKARGAQYARTLQGILLNRIEGIPPGPARTAEAKKAMAEYIEQLQQSGRLVSPADRAAMTQVIKDTVEVSDELVFTQAPTGIEQNYMNQLSTTNVLTFNRQEWIDRMNEVANTLALDPERQDQFIERAMAQINSLDEQTTTFGPYKGIVEDTLNKNIDRSINLRYGQLRANYPVDVKESENRLREYAFERITKQLLELSKQEDGQLSFPQVRGVVNDVFKEIRDLKNDTEDAKFLFPGAAGPSVEPGGEADFQDVSATQTKPATTDAAAPAPAPVQLYRVGELDTIPNRRQVLVEWNTRPIMHLQDIRVELNNVLNGGQLSPEVQRAWRDGGADNGFQYLMRQLDAFPSYNRTLDFPPEVMEQIKKRLVSFDALSNKLMSVASLQSRPQLSRLNNWALDIAFG